MNSEEKAIMSGGMKRERRTVSEETDSRKVECVQAVRAHKPHS